MKFVTKQRHQSKQNDIVRTCCLRCLFKKNTQQNFFFVINVTSHIRSMLRNVMTISFEKYFCYQRSLSNSKPHNQNSLLTELISTDAAGNDTNVNFFFHYFCQFVSFVLTEIFELMNDLQAIQKNLIITLMHYFWLE